MFNIAKNSSTNHQANTKIWDSGRVPGTQIRFDPKLIDRLTAEHHELLAACEKLELACEKERISQIAEQLRLLEEYLLQHRMQEDIKLMIFIEKRYSNNAQMVTLLSLFRKEREGLKRQLSEFFAKYTLLRECPGLVVDLRGDISKAIKLIMGMIDSEEQNFFPLYSLDVKVNESEQAAELAS